ncbi:hypothetical protein TREES_T100010941 [Tupaia chinensis]|uniref:Uncharacterized protein n=1 Tax=Tupaia chinensis TaxID=246437 RepID=L9JJF1_TUPCH|nr:hypothetical protein TREES_T100010941 [Tupaia chinensis]
MLSEDDDGHETHLTSRQMPATVRSNTGGRRKKVRFCTTKGRMRSVGQPAISTTSAIFSEGKGSCDALVFVQIHIVVLA